RSGLSCFKLDPIKSADAEGRISVDKVVLDGMIQNGAQGGDHEPNRISGMPLLGNLFREECFHSGASDLRKVKPSESRQDVESKVPIVALPRVRLTLDLGIILDPLGGVLFQRRNRLVS